MGRSLVQEFITDDFKTAVQAVLDQALAGDETDNFEFPLITKGGARIEVLLNATTRRDEQGNVIGKMFTNTFMHFCFIYSISNPRDSSSLFQVWWALGKTLLHVWPKRGNIPSSLIQPMLPSSEWIPWEASWHPCVPFFLFCNDKLSYHVLIYLFNSCECMESVCHAPGGVHDQ